MAHTSKANTDIAGMAAVFSLLLRIALKAIATVSAGRDNRRFMRQLLSVLIPPAGTALVGTEPLLLAVFLLDYGLTALSAETELRNWPELRLGLNVLALTK
jgi:hypothetical protein